MKKTRILWVLLASIIILLFGCGKQAVRESIPVEQLDEAAVQNTMIQYEKVIADAEQIIDDYLNESGTVTPEDYDQVLSDLSQFAKTLYEQGEITHHSYQPGDTCVYIEIDGWLGVLLDAPIEGYMNSDGNAAQVVTLEPNAAEFTLSYIGSGMGGPMEAAMLISQNLPNFSFSRMERNEDVTIESFKQPLKNSVMIFCGHGKYTSELGPVLFTGIEAWDPSTLLLYTIEMGEKAICVNSKGDFYLTHIFFDKYVPENAYDGSLLYLGACSSAHDSRLIKSLFDKGARAVIGNTTTIWVPYNYGMIYSFFQGMSLKNADGNYRTVSEALEYAKNLEGQTDPNPFAYGSEVVAYYTDDFQLPMLPLSSELGYYLAPNAKIRVFGLDDELYHNYTLTISGNATVFGPVLSSEGKKVNKTVVITEATPYVLDLENGRYTFTVTDNINPDRIKTFLVTIGNDGASKLDVETQFGSLALTGEKLVSDAYSDSVLNTYWSEHIVQCYHIPRINLGGPDMDGTNKQIYQKLYGVLEANIYANMDDPDYYPLISEMAYISGTDNKLVSVVVRVLQTDYDWTDYYVFNVSAQNGKILDKTETLSALGLTDSEFGTLARQAVQYYWDSRADLLDHISSDYYQSLLNDSLSDDNIQTAIPWINEKGELCIMIGIYWPAGGGYYYHLLDSAGNDIDADFDCGVTHLYVEPVEQGTEPIETSPVLKGRPISSEELLGTWHIDADFTMEYNNTGMTNIFGSAYKYGNEMQFGSNSTFSFYIGAGIGGEGVFDTAGDIIKANLTTYETGEAQKIDLWAIENGNDIRLVLYIWDYTIFWIKK